MIGTWTKIEEKLGHFGKEIIDKNIQQEKKLSETRRQKRSRPGNTMTVFVLAATLGPQREWRLMVFSIPLHLDQAIVMEYIIL
jgi:hypothetical protein